MSYDFDVFVIGAGSGGVRAGRISASLGAKVAIAESRYLGGTCVNVGCVPKKLLVYASAYSELMHEAQGFGWQGGLDTIDWPMLRDKKATEIARLNGIYQRLLDNAGVTVLHGSAEIMDAHTVAVDGKQYTAEKILIATGGWPRKGKYPGAELAITSNEFFSMQALPLRVLVEGGGYIAVEFAGILNGFGCTTELVYRGPLFLRGFDHEVREFVAEEVTKKGVTLSFNTQIQSIEKLDSGELLVTLNDESQRVVDCVVSAIGRQPMIEGLGLEHVNVARREDGTIVVDARFQTTEPSIYAIGDVVGYMPLTPVALREGELLARHWFEGGDIQLDYTKVPTAMFSQPNVATVGLTEEDAQKRFAGDITIYKSTFKPMKHTLSGLEEKTLMKLVVRKSDNRVLGCHMVGESAGEIIQGLAVAINMGATKADFDATLGIHPTSAEEFVTMR